jgi:hypothetical protein
VVAWFIPFLVGMFSSALVGPALAPVQTKIAQTFSGVLQPSIPDPSTLVVLRWKRKIDEETFYSLMRLNGFSRDNATLLFHSQARVMDADALVSALWRGIITEAEYYEKMHALGFTREEAEKYERVSRYFPGPADLVRFAVREVYTPEVRAKYGMDEDLPPQFLEEAKKAGMTEEQARNYWAAHWVLPSLSEGYEMLHRGVITEEELKTLMRVQDIMPYWRDRLIKISYEPYTRVDVRRMYAMGVLNRDQVKRAYMDLGYDEEKAERLTEFTVRYEAREELKAATEPILEALRIRDITPEEALDQLKALGLPEERAAALVQKEVVKLENEEREKWADVLSDLYIRGVMDETHFQDSLGKLNLSAQAMERIKTLAELERMKRSEFPSLSDIRRWLMKNLIDISQAKEIMKRMNYPEELINLYIADWTSPVEEPEPKLPSKEDIRLFVRKGIIDEETARALLRMLRYPEPVIDWYLRDWVGG